MRGIRDWPRVTVALLSVVLALCVRPGAASAHTSLDYSVPADGEAVESPVDEVTVAFTAPVELVGNGFEALDPQGNLLRPAVVSDDDQVFRLLFDSPLAGGGVGIRYEIRAADGHVLSGSFSFVVEAPAPTTEPAPPAPATTAPTTPSTSPAEAPASSATAATTTVSSPLATSETVAVDVTSSVDREVTTTAPPADDASNGGSNTGMILLIAAALGLGVGGFFLIRARTSAGP